MILRQGFLSGFIGWIVSVLSVVKKPMVLSYFFRASLVTEASM